MSSRADPRPLRVCLFFVLIDDSCLLTSGSGVLPFVLFPLKGSLGEFCHRNHFQVFLICALFSPTPSEFPPFHLTEAHDSSRGAYFNPFSGRELSCFNDGFFLTSTLFDDSCSLGAVFHLPLFFPRVRQCTRWICPPPPFFPFYFEVLGHL